MRPSVASLSEISLRFDALVHQPFAAPSSEAPDSKTTASQASARTATPPLAFIRPIEPDAFGQMAITLPPAARRSVMAVSSASVDLGSSESRSRMSA